MGGFHHNLCQEVYEVKMKRPLQNPRGRILCILANSDGKLERSYLRRHRSNRRADSLPLWLQAGMCGKSQSAHVRAVKTIFRDLVSWCLSPSYPSHSHQVIASHLGAGPERNVSHQLRGSIWVIGQHDTNINRFMNKP